MIKRALKRDIILPIPGEKYDKWEMSTFAESIISAFGSVYDDFSSFFYRWGDLEYNVANLKVNPVTSKPVYDFSEGIFLFSEGSTETVIGSRQWPHEAISNSEASPHIHWIQERAGVVKWQIEYKAYQLGQPIPASWTTLTTTSQLFPYTSGAIQQYSEFPHITLPLSISDVVVVKVSRLGADAEDTYTGYAKFLSFDFHIQKDAFGSRLEREK